MTADPDEILIRVDNSVGIVTLNRPKAINSLTHNMVTLVDRALTQWADDPTITAVVLNGAGERGLCAGGDLVPLYHSAQAGGADARKFWFDEYRLDAKVGSYPKPYVSLMDGIVMGGGVGVSAHGSVRVVTETSKIAMPEVSIGFVPDVGGTYLLARAPGLLGLHAALSGAPFSGADAIALGFADHYIPHAALEAFTAAVVGEGVEAAVRAYEEDPPPSQMLAQRHWIDQCYAGETAIEIVAALRGHDAGPANDAANLIESRSPVSAHWKMSCARSIGQPAGRCAVTTSSKASEPRSSTRIATRSGPRRHWPR